MGCLAYADDFILLSSSVIQLQDMLNLCSLHAEELDIKFNAEKSCLFKVGRNFEENISNLQFGSSNS